MKLDQLNYLDPMTWYGTKRARELRKGQTPAEKILWNELRNRKLLNLKFYRQHVIRYGQGNTIFIADFYCHEKKLVIELDGCIHLTNKDYDTNRDGILKEYGYAVLRFKNEELDELLKVIDKIKAHIS